MRHNLWLNRKVVVAVALFGTALGTTLSPVWSADAARTDTAPVMAQVPTITAPTSATAESAPLRSGGWYAMLSTAGTALYWGAQATVASGQQVAEGAYYLGGELVESSRIVGVHAVRAMGVSGTPRSGREDTVRGDRLVKEWGKTGTAFENSPTTLNTAAASTAPVVRAAPTAAIAPMPATASAEGQNSLLMQAALKPSRQPEAPVDVGKDAAASKALETDLSAQCDWPGLTAPATPPLDGDGIRLLTELGLMNEGARRLSDGTVFFPKVSQRLLQIRTGYACDGAVASSRRLVGHVIANPSSSGLVQAEQAGRIEAGEFGFPRLGQRVEQGELLGYLAPTWSSRDRVEIEAEIEILRGEVAKLELNLARTREMPLLPFRDGRILSLRLELNKLRSQRDTLISGLEGRQPLLASVSGVVARADVRVGQVVEARELLWEIADTTDLWIEAEWFGGEPLAETVNATAVMADDRVIQLDYQGAGWTLGGGQSAPLQFRIRSAVRGLRIGEQLIVHVRQISKEQGTLIPKSARVRRGNGEMTAWRSISPERFEPVRVSWKPVDGNMVLVEAGLPKHARVVLAGASLLSEVR
ncbi:MAG: HlyD family efflux transporter periplasmic adaptor subunit [Alphaproteobacteria bacterium]|nr:HlyD family efflux transporter periplasmic adaptor subunit [Alphaproteobacteria bacterium]